MKKQTIITEFPPPGPVYVNPHECERGTCEFCGEEGLVISEYHSKQPMLMAMKPIVSEGKRKLFSQNGVFYPTKPGDMGYIPHYVVCQMVSQVLPPANSTAVKLNRLEVVS